MGFFKIKMSRFFPTGRSGSFLFAALMLIHLRMPSCEAQVILWGHDLDNMAVTIDVGLNAIKDNSGAPDQWFLRWDGLILEYEFIQKRAAMLYGINSTGILSGSLAFGVSNGFEKEELGMEIKAMGGVLIFPVDISMIPAYSYRKHGPVINVVGSVGLGMLLPVFSLQ